MVAYLPRGDWTLLNMQAGDVWDHLPAHRHCLKPLLSWGLPKVEDSDPSMNLS